MPENIPALIAEARERHRRTARHLPDPAAPTLVSRLADALESLFAPPATDDERRELEYRLARHRVGPVGPNVRNADDVALAEELLGRRPSPLTREALEAAWHKGYEEAESDHYGTGFWDRQFRSGRAQEVAEAILSRFALPEPAEVEWEYGRRNRMTGGVRPLNGPPLPSWWNESQDKWEHVKSPKRPERLWVPVEKGAEQ